MEKAFMLRQPTLFQEQVASKKPFSKSGSTKNNTIAAAKELQRIDRILATFSACQKVLVRSRDKSELLQNICRAVVDAGGYRMAWVGIANDDSEKTIQPMGCAGDNDGFLDSINVTWNDSNGDLCPSGRAILNGKPYVVKNILTEPDYISWRGEALKRAYASSVSLPLNTKTGTFGALSIYADEADIFTPDEVELLMELADNLVYGVKALHTKAQRYRAELEVKKSLNQLRQAFGAIIQVLEQTVELQRGELGTLQSTVKNLTSIVQQGDGETGGSLFPAI